MNTQQRQALIDAALSTRQMAYAPYSKFLVGAAVLTESGSIHVGCNIENASYGLTICARGGLEQRRCRGKSGMAAMAVATTGGCPPCGACRQFATEFRSDLPILLVDADHPERVLETNLAVLLPSQFHLG